MWNTVLPSKVYVILSADGKILCEQVADRAHIALSAARADWGDTARTAMLKTDYLRTEKETKWLRASARVEA